MKEILISQNKHWNGEKYSSIRREKLDKLISYLPLRQIITITGVRRCGKSTLAKQAINYLIENGVNPKNIFFINLEHPYFLDYKHNPNYLHTIFEEYLKLINPKGKIYCIFDEIQFFDNWQVYIKSQYENSDIKYIITGSNSSLLSNDLNTLLSGRSLNIHLDTFSFREFLDYKGIEYKSEFDIIKNKIEIKRSLDEYLKWGGFYEVFSAVDDIKNEILLSYAKNIIYQDIIPRYSIRNSEIVERLYFYLVSNVGGILNYSTLSDIFKISDKTIKEYIKYFEDVFLLKRIDKYHTKQKEQIKSQKKIYSLDNGFIQIAPKHSKNLGSLLENQVFIELQKIDKVMYLKDLYEIDFKCQNTLYQVSYDLSNIKTKKREFQAFDYLDKNNKFKHKIITYDENYIENNVEVESIGNFLLGLKNGI